MKQKDLYQFVVEFNKLQFIPQKTIIEGLKTLPESDHELFMKLVNYKNSGVFRDSLDNGEI